MGKKPPAAFSPSLSLDLTRPVVDKHFHGQAAKSPLTQSRIHLQSHIYFTNGHKQQTSTMNPFERQHCINNNNNSSNRLASSSTSSLTSGSGDPFKATKMWDEIVYAFCLGMPAKRHRRRLRTFPDCFTGRKAVDWMHQYLMFSSYFGKNEVSRFQAVQLLRKFMHHDIIQPVSMKDCDPEKLMEFKDSRDLYVLSPAVTQVLPISSSSSSSSILPQNIPLPPDMESEVDHDITNISMDIEADPVPVSTSSLRRPAHPPPPPPPQVPFSHRSPVSASPSLNCCIGGTTGSVNITSMTRSPLKPVNRSQSAATATARIRRIPDDVFWL